MSARQHYVAEWLLAAVAIVLTAAVVVGFRSAEPAHRNLFRHRPVHGCAHDHTCPHIDRICQADQDPALTVQIGFETGLAGWRPIGAARIQRDPLAREGRQVARFNGTGVADQGIALPAVLRCKLGKSYDHRTHWSGPDPPAVAADPDHRQVVVPNWQIPLRVGQRTALVQGDIVWVPGPSPWLWRLLAAAAFALMVLVGWRSWYSLLAVLVVIAVTADAFHTIGALMGSPAPLPTKLSASLISVVAWAAALAALWQLRRRRLQAGRILLLVAGTLLAFASAVSDARTLASSQLVTTLDPALTRTGIALTLRGPRTTSLSVSCRGGVR